MLNFEFILLEVMFSEWFGGLVMERRVLEAMRLNIAILYSIATRLLQVSRSMPDISLEEADNSYLAGLMAKIT